MTGNRPLVRWLWRGYLRPHRAMIALAVVLMAVEGAMLGLLSYIIQPMFDQVFIAGDRSAITWVALAVFGIFLARAVAGFGQRVLMMSGRATGVGGAAGGHGARTCCGSTARGFRTIHPAR